MNPSSHIEKPINRNSVRLYLGRQYYTLKRSLQRYHKQLSGEYRFAKIAEQDLRHTIFSHSTPLFRDLKDDNIRLQQGKVVNLKIATAKVNGITIFPGEVFSYWHAIGRPSARKGYAPGMILRNGAVRAGIGGGLCQLSNLIYWMTLHTDLSVFERHRHGYDVFPDANRTQPFGSGATCFYNYGDLMIKNETDRAFQLKVTVTEDSLEGAWRCDGMPPHSYEVYEKEHLIRSEYWGGYTRHNVIYRKKYDRNMQFIDDEYVVENHALMMYAPLLSDGK